MRVGLVTKWFNRGQPVVARQLRSALEELGHETYVLARPKKERGPMKGRLQRDGVWDQPRVDTAAAYDITAEEYGAWVERRGIEAVLCDQNYQFAELAELRRRGVLVIGRFVWEHFTADHVRGRARGLRPRLLDDALRAGALPRRSASRRPTSRGGSTPSSSPSSPPRATTASCRSSSPAASSGIASRSSRCVDAFMRTTDERLRLLVKAQVERKGGADAAREAAASDDRIEFRLGDEPTEEHLRAFAAADVCLAPSRWEGLGLPLFEATAFGLPVITNDIPPLNEVIEHERNGLLVALASRTGPRSRGSRPTTRTSTRWRRRSSGSPTTAERAAPRGRRARGARRSAAGIERSRASGS